jgi:dCTP deaminase
MVASDILNYIECNLCASFLLVTLDSKMILLRSEIKKQMERGKIKITPFDESRLNPNSINLTLADELMIYDEIQVEHCAATDVLDPRRENVATIIKIPEKGFILRPGELYLGRTAEYTETNGYVPMLEGRSSIGRLGVAIHVTAGFGDIGFSGYWTLELFVVRPVRLYAGLEIAQIYYHDVIGDRTDVYKGRYQNNTGIQPCLLHEKPKKPDFEAVWTHGREWFIYMNHCIVARISDAEFKGLGRPYEKPTYEDYLILIEAFTEGDNVITDDGHIGIYKHFDGENHWVFFNGMSTNLPYQRGRIKKHVPVC